MRRNVGLPPTTLGGKPRNPRLDPADPWIRRHAWAVSIQKVHAVGVLVLMWSNAEKALIDLAGAACGIDEKLAWTLFHDQGDVRLIEKIKNAAQLQELPTNITDRLYNYLKYYNICRLNRNIVVHSINIANIKGTSLRKLTKNHMETTSFKSSVGHIRGAADYVHALSNAMIYLTYTLRQLRQGKSLSDLNELLLVLAPLLDPPEDLQISTAAPKASR